MNRDELENIDNLFNIAYMIGNYNKPLSDKEMLMDKYGVNYHICFLYKQVLLCYD